MRRLRLVERRQELGMKQEDVARALGVPRTTYVRYETGSRRPSIDVVLRIAQILDKPVETLFGDTVTVR